jgi:hypothetical protein
MSLSTSTQPSSGARHSREVASAGMTPEERRVLERAVQRVTEQAANANAIVDEAMDARLDGSEPFIVNIKGYAQSSCR